MIQSMVIVGAAVVVVVLVVVVVVVSVVDGCSCLRCPELQMRELLI